MDQLKQFLAQAAKHQFWIIIGTAVLLSGLAWYLTSSNLSKLYAEQEAVIKGKFGDMDRVSNSLRTHPNQDSQAEMQRIIASLSDDVQQAWEEQYQRQEEYLRWPDTIGLPRLIAKLKSYYPVELKLSFPDEPSDVVEGDKLSFSSYFDRQLPELAKIIGVEWSGQVVDTSSGTGTGVGLGSMGSGFSPDDPSGADGGATFGAGLSGLRPAGRPGSRDVVRWPSSSQSELLNSIRLWQGNKPTVYEMIYTQENMWVLEGLFNIIAKTNIVPQTQRPATANVQAAIKEIEFIRIGAAAIGDAGDVTIPAQPGGASSMDEGFGGLRGSFASDSGGGPEDYSSDSSSTGFGGGLGGIDGMEGLGAGTRGDGQPRDPADRRYVDRDFKPILGDDLRSRIASEDPADAYFAVAKRVPVRIRMTVDALRIQEFLANCGNEGLMLEVRQVRLGNTTPASISGRSGLAAGAMSLGGGLGGGMGSPHDGPDADYGSSDSSSDYGMGMGMGSSMGSGALRRGPRIPKDIKVEVYGIVYLFYPVNIDRLGLNKVDENTELTETVEDTEEVEQLTAPGPEQATEDAAENGPEPASVDQPPVTSTEEP